MTNTIYLRPASRLPKIIALAVVLDHLRRNGSPMPSIVLESEKCQPKGEGVYNLDCNGNGYRDRKMKSEVAVVIEDFKIQADSAVKKLLDMVNQHNDSGVHSFWMNRLVGSLGFFTGSAWEVIDAGKHEIWKTRQDLVNGCIEVVHAFINAERARIAGTAKPWPADEMPSELSAILSEEYIDIELGSRAVSEGKYKFPTLSGYLCDLYQLGVSAEDIDNRLDPWLDLWETCENFIVEARREKPADLFSVRTENSGRYKGVVFDFTDVAESDLNPLLHNVWLATENVRAVIVRRPDGHVAIFTTDVIYGSVSVLSQKLNELEPGLWYHDGGLAVYNGSKSRSDHPLTKLPLVGQVAGTLPSLAAAYLKGRDMNQSRKK